MKTEKAISWEKLSEGILTAKEIENLELNKVPITMTMVNSDPRNNHALIISIIRLGKNKYQVIDVTGMATKRAPYKYLSCAVRRAVKEYKIQLRSSNTWRIVTKT